MPANCQLIALRPARLGAGHSPPWCRCWPCPGAGSRARPCPQQRAGPGTRPGRACGSPGSLGGQRKGRSGWCSAALSGREGSVSRSHPSPKSPQGAGWCHQRSRPREGAPSLQQPGHGRMLEQRGIVVYGGDVPGCPRAWDSLCAAQEGGGSAHSRDTQRVPPHHGMGPELRVKARGHPGEDIAARPRATSSRLPKRVGA